MVKALLTSDNDFHMGPRPVMVPSVDRGRISHLLNFFFLISTSLAYSNRGPYIQEFKAVGCPRFFGSSVPGLGIRSPISLPALDNTGSARHRESEVIQALVCFSVLTFHCLFLFPKKDFIHLVLPHPRKSLYRRGKDGGERNASILKIGKALGLSSIR